MARKDDPAASEADLRRMLDLAKATARHLGTPRQSPFCADVIHSTTGKRLVRRLNAVAQEHDPSSHAEVRAIRAATKKLKTTSLKGYTLYTTCDRIAVLSQKKVLVADTLEVVAATQDDWIQEYFHGPRGRAAAVADALVRGTTPT